MNAFHVLFILVFVATRAKTGNIFAVYSGLRIIRRKGVMRTVAGLANRDIFYALSEGLTVNAQPILLGRRCRCPEGTRKVTDTAVYLSDFLMRIGDDVKVAAVARTHTMN